MGSAGLWIDSSVQLWLEVQHVFTEQNELCDWLILGHVLLIKFNRNIERASPI